VEINDDLIRQWEPKVQKMASKTSIVGMEQEDIAQELRLVICKAAKKYSPDRNASFHTYLHTSMVNTIRTLITKAQARLKRQPVFIQIPDDGSNQTLEELAAVEDPGFNTVAFVEELKQLNLTPTEQKYIEAKLNKYNNKEIYFKLGGISPHKIRAQVKDKLLNYYAYQDEKTTDL
jgi:RNA polymerase sigma factor (sigma-70 family)|tara:strand:- start:2948 stop:3475 length:528 start_codon:yes stop_codon:yes gene_type:complete